MWRPNKYKDMRTQARENSKEKSTTTTTKSTIEDKKSEKKTHEKAQMEFKVIHTMLTTWCWPRKTSVFAFCVAKLYISAWNARCIFKHRANAYNIFCLMMPLLYSPFIYIYSRMNVDFVLVDTQSRCVFVYYVLYICIRACWSKDPNRLYVGVFFFFYLRRRTHKYMVKSN